MDCKEIRALFDPYLDGRISRKEREEVENHLSWCYACREEYLTLERVALLLEGQERVPAPPWFAHRVMEEVYRQRSAHSRARVVLYGAWALASLLGLALIVEGGLAVYQAVIQSSDSLVEGSEGVSNSAADLSAANPELMDTLFILLANLESDLVLGLSLVFVSSCLALVALMNYRPPRTAYR
ncbi:MAG: putative transrane transcriptional regulator (anti-sigma factor) [Dehalococcoidia bacterium]|nr:putative transrane transcriptional regulator (anti-sigma factor) [Dehalococcoidia bacterium]